MYTLGTPPYPAIRKVKARCILAGSVIKYGYMLNTPAPFAWNFCPICGGSLESRDDGESLRPHCGHCNRFYYLNPVPAACCVVKDGNGKVVFVQRAVEPAKGLWTLPGGFVEVCETTDEAALRELEEETDIRGRRPTLFGASTQPSALSGAVVVLGYRVDDWEGEMTARSDAMDVGLFGQVERPPLAFEAHRELLALYDALDRPVQADESIG